MAAAAINNLFVVIEGFLHKMLGCPAAAGLQQSPNVAFVPPNSGYIATVGSR
jgi:hypothetical protein